MNILFGVICLISLAVLAVKNPDGVLAAATAGANKALTLSFTLIVVYTVWSGFLQIAEDSGVCDKLAALLKKPLGALFPLADEKTKRLIAANVSANVLGMGGLATPPAIAATKLMTDRGDYDGATTLFVLASTSVQLLPSTVITLRQSVGSVSAADIFLPTLISTLIGTAVGLCFCKVFKKRNENSFASRTRNAYRARSVCKR